MEISHQETKRWLCWLRQRRNKSQGFATGLAQQGRGPADWREGKSKAQLQVFISFLTLSRLSQLVSRSADCLDSPPVYPKYLSRVFTQIFIQNIYPEYFGSLPCSQGGSDPVLPFQEQLQQLCQGSLWIPTPAHTNILLPRENLSLSF